MHMIHRHIYIYITHPYYIHTHMFFTSELSVLGKAKPEQKAVSTRCQHFAPI